MAKYNPTLPAAMRQSSTYNGNAVTTDAGIAAMKAIPAPERTRVHTLGTRLRAGLEGLVSRHQIEAKVAWFGSFAALRFTAGPIQNIRDRVGTSQSFRRPLHMA